MNQKSFLRASAKWLAAGVGVAGAAYGAYVGLTWYRYGDAAPPILRNRIRCSIDSCPRMTSLNVITSASLRHQP